MSTATTLSPTATTTAPTVRPTRLRAPAGGLLVGDRQYRGGVYLPASARPALEAVAAKAATVARVEPVMIGIMGFSYRVESISIDPEIGDTAFNLHDTDRNRLYSVHRDQAGEVVCDCGDYVFRKAGTGSTCKHGRRLVELGLIPAPTPTTLPPFAARIADSAPTPARPRRFEPIPDEIAEAANLFRGATR